MRNEVSFPNNSLLSGQLSRLMSLPGQSPATQHILLTHMLDVLKSDRARLKATGKLTAKGDTNLITMTLSVARELNALRAKDSGLSALANQPDQHRSALSDVLITLKNEHASCRDSGMPTTLLAKVTQSIIHKIDTLKATAVTTANDPRPEGKPPPSQLFSSGSPQTGSFLRSAWLSARQTILPASMRLTASLGVAALAAQLTASSAPDTVAPETFAILPPSQIIIETTQLPPLSPLNTASSKRAPRAVPAFARQAEETVIKAVGRSAKVAKQNLDDLFHKPELLTIALGKLENMKVDVAFRKAVLVESGGHQFDKDGNPLKSNKGATGKAQVMPDTARQIAEKCTGEPLDTHRFNNDPDYNYSLGKCYYRARTAAYGGNPVMGALDYNLGPVRMQKHIDRVGDPTRGEISMVRFIETMPIKETRHYPLQMLVKAGLIEKAKEELESKALPTTTATAQTPEPVSESIPAPSVP
jgi:hypothetical protein